MQNPEILLETADVDEIASLISTASAVVKILTGETNGGTKYPFSYTQYAKTGQIAAVLSEVASATSGWNSGIRACDDESTQRRFVYITAVVIPELAMQLLRRAEELGYRKAIPLFKNLVTLNRSVNYDTRKAGDVEVNPNMFRTAARDFYYALQSACEEMTPTRPQATIDTDYSAASEVNDLLDIIAKQYDSYEIVVKSILDVAGINPDTIAKEKIDDAVKLNMAVIVLNKYVNGAELKGNPWFSQNQPAARILYKLVSETWRTGVAKKRVYDDDVKDAGSVKEVNVSELVNSDTDDIDGGIDDIRVRMEVKDMDTLGDNTKQMNTLNARTRFTCRQFYKVFGINALSGFRYEERYVKFMYRLLYFAFKEAGFDLPVPSEGTAELFATTLDAILSEQASNTMNALTLHSTIRDELELYENYFASNFKKTYMSRPFNRLFIEQLDEDSQSNMSEAFRAIRRLVICGGSSDLGGMLVNQEDVSASGLPQPIVSFGLYSGDDRKKTLGLSTSGEISSKFFKFDGNELKVEYTGALTDRTIESDVIQRNDIRHVYKDYVSSSLMPITLPNRTRAWVVLVGILAYSELKQGDFADVKQPSELIQKQLDVVANANIYSNSQVSASTRADRRWHDKDFRDDLTSYGFIAPDEIDNDDTRDAIIKRVSDNVTANVSDEMTKARRMCDLYNNAITNYIDRTVEKTYGLRVKDLRDAFLSISPTPEDLVAGGQAVIDNVVSTLVKMISPDSGVDISPLCDVYTAYNVMAMRYEAKSSLRVVMRNTCYYYSKLTHAMSMTEVTSQPKLRELLIGLLPEDSQQKYKELKALDDKISSAQNDSARATALKAAKLNAPKLIESFVVAGRDTSGHTGISALLEVIKKHERTLSESQDSDIAQLYQDFLKSVEYGKDNVTLATINHVQVALAMTMEGSPQANLNKVTRYNISQFVKATALLKSLDGIVNPSTDEVETNNIDVDYDISRGGTPEMSELTVMSKENENNVKLNQLYTDIHNSIDEPSNIADVELDGDYIERVLKLCNNYMSAKDMVASIKDDFTQFMEFARSKDKTAPSDDNLKAWGNYIQNAYELSPGMTTYGEKIIKSYKRATIAESTAKEVLKQYKKAQPHMVEISDAIEQGKITVDELKYAIKEAGIAAECLGNLSKYATIYGATKVDRRLFAYTMSDESAIAQIIYILSQYIMIPSTDDKSDLVATLTNASNIIEKYSGNPMSRRVASDALSRVEACTSNGELVPTVIKLICSYGKILLSRLSNDVDQARLMGVSSVVDPANRSSGYGRAMDAFARTQLRSKGNDEMTKQIARLGETLDSERAGRKSYISLVIDDMKENPELAKYAYTLGKAFNVFDRSMMDERVSDIEKRIFNSIESSFTGVALYKGLATNDLQRELISAIIDDERHGDTEQYPTVASVLDAARHGGNVHAYKQMYSDKVGSSDDILNDTRSLTFGFNQNGKKVAADTGVALDDNTIYQLVTGENGRYTDVKDLVHTVRISICNRIINRFGTFDLEGNIQLSGDYADKANDLMKAAMQSLYRLCNDMDTPLSSIIVATNSLGQKGGRKIIMKLVSDKLLSGEDIDIDTLGMVSGEPNAYPQMMSNELSGADIEWVGNMANILARIPASLSRKDVRVGTRMYCENQASQIDMMGSDLRGLVSVIEHLLVLDTPTGIPTGIWGDDSTARKQHITDLMDRFASRKTDDNTWVDCAQEWYNDFVEKYKNGKRSIAFASILPCQAAMRRIAHLRVNPYYTMDIDEKYLDDVNALETDLVDEGIIVKNGNFVKLKYPGLTFDRNTFTYICLLAIKLGKISKGFDSVSKFTTALMCYVSGVRIGVCLDVLAETKDAMNSDDKRVLQKIQQVMGMVAQTYQAKDFGEMTKTSLGWLTHIVFVSLCTKAAMDKGNPVENFRNAFDAITDGGTKSYDLSEVTKRTDGVADEDSAGEEAEELPVNNPEPAPEEHPVPAASGDTKNGSTPIDADVKKSAESMETDASDAMEKRLADDPMFNEGL